MTRENAIKQLKDNRVLCINSETEPFAIAYDMAIKALDQEPQIRPKGYWFVDERPESNREVVCSNCDQPIFKYHKLDFDYRPKFCPNCGAKMEVV